MWTRRDGLSLELVVAQTLLVGHADQIVLDGAARQFGLDVALAPAEHHRLQPAHQLVEVLVADRPAAFVEVVKIAIEAEQRTQQARIEVLHDRVDLVDAVLDRRAGEHERIGRCQRLHRARRLGVPVLDPLRLVEDDDVGPQRAVDVGGVDDDLLVVDHGEEAGLRVLREPCRPAAGDQQRGGAAEPRDLLLPFAFERRRAHHQHTGDPVQPAQQFGGGDRLDGLAEAHVVGQQRALAEGEVEHALALIRQQRMVQEVDAFACLPRLRPRTARGPRRVPPAAVHRRATGSR